MLKMPPLGDGHAPHGQRKVLDDLYAEWLALRAGEIRDKDATDDEVRRRRCRQEELARVITTTPAPLFWLVLRKLEVLEYYLGQYGGTGWDDNREVVMLAGIKADLMRISKGAG